MPSSARSIGCLAWLILLAACSNGRGSLEDQQSPPPTSPAQAALSIGGTVSGLTGSGLVLQNNGSDNLTIATDGSFTFAGTVATGAAYNVVVLTQPASPAQTCTVASGSGNASANVTTVAVTCTTEPRFSVGGSVSGLVGSGLVLQNNGGDDLPIATNGNFTFATAVANNAAYNVTVRTQPSGQNCVVQSAAGTIASANVTNVAVSCMANQFTVGGTVSGLGGTGLALQLNGGSNLSLVRDGPFAFATALPPGAAYQVTVGTNPNDPAQTCTVANGSGTIASANVANVAVTCVTRRFAVGGVVSGLAGTGLRLRLNGGSELAIPSNGNFAFPNTLLSGTSYTVSVAADPSGPTQICSVAPATGTVRDADVSVAVTCATQSFAIRGTVSGLVGSGLALFNNGGDRIAISADGAFSFPTNVASGGTFNVTVASSPANPTQACSIANGAGTVTDRDVANIAVTCSVSNFTIGGNVANLAGNGLILRNNGIDSLTLNSSGPFTFSTAIPSGQTYSVTIERQPTAPSQTCVVTNPSGPVLDRNITTVALNCSTEGFTISVQVTGLTGGGLVLQNNGADDLAIASDGRYTFPTPLPFRSPYNVSVLTQPAGQACTVTDGSGVVFLGSIDNVLVQCFATGL